MAGELLNFDPNLGPPPQAPTPVATAADQGAITQAQSAQDVLRASAFGDKGAEQYAALVNAGQPAPAMPPVAGGAGLTGLVGSRAPVSPVSNANVTDPIANALMALGGQDPTKMAMQQQQLAASRQQMEIAREREFRENAAEFYTSLMPSVFKSFPGRPDLAAATLQRAAVSRGLTVDPAVLTKLNQDMSDGSLPREKFNKIITDPGTDMSTLVRLGANAKFANDAIEAVAHADEAIAKAKNAPALEATKLGNQALEMASRIRQAQKPPTLEELQILDSAGLAAWQIPMPGSPSQKMWTTGPKDQAPKGAAADVRNVEEQKAAAKAPPMTIQRAREQVGSAQDTAKVLLGMLNDPKFAEAKKSLGPDLTANVAGFQVGPSQFNRVWRNYKDYGGEGNTTEQNKLMEAIGYYTGTGFQAFLAGLRNQKIVEDIRVHIPQPFDKEDTIRSKIDYLSSRYTDILKEFAKGGRPVGAQETTGGGASQTPPPSTGTISAADFLAQ